MTNIHPILLPIIIPAIASFLLFLVPCRIRFVKEAILLTATAANLFFSVSIFGKLAYFSARWAGPGFEFILRNDHFSSFIISAAASFGLLIAVYSSASLSGKKYSKSFFTYYLISLAFANGAILSDSLITMLFFWEGLLITLFGMIAIGNKNAFKTATKAFIIVGISDLCMMAGIAISGHLAGTLTMSKMSISIGGLGGLAFILLMIGAISKAGSMPFHSWIPDAAVDAPLPFMAILPASLEKLLGIYFLARISLFIFKLERGSWVSMTLMILGSITILLAVMMALIQKDYKRLLSYHAISQVGYMILGIGTLVPAGIVGGLFHMINHAMYKSCLFLTGGSVEKQAGTTDLEKLGGLWKSMPVTFACFVVAAASISGVPPFNGFFSKELVYDGALERGVIFYIAATLGSFLTAASFLKLGHSAFLGKRADNSPAVKEAPIAMLIPMISIAFACVLFGLWNALPLNNLIQPILGPGHLEGQSFAGWPANTMVVLITMAVLIAACLNHIYGIRKGGSAIKCADHIHYAPALSGIYDKAEKGVFDPYNIGSGLVDIFSLLMWRIDRAIDWVYNILITGLAKTCTVFIRRLHSGSYKLYIAWSLGATIVIVALFIK